MVLHCCKPSGKIQCCTDCPSSFLLRERAKSRRGRPAIRRQRLSRQAVFRRSARRARTRAVGCGAPPRLAYRTASADRALVPRCSAPRSACAGSRHPLCVVIRAGDDQYARWRRLLRRISAPRRTAGGLDWRRRRIRGRSCRDDGRGAPEYPRGGDDQSRSATHAQGCRRRVLGFGKTAVRECVCCRRRSADVFDAVRERGTSAGLVTVSGWFDRSAGRERSAAWPRPGNPSRVPAGLERHPRTRFAVGALHRRLDGSESRS